jgi:hypothetical protein
MSQATDYLENKILTGLLGGTNVTFPSKPYVGLLKSAPTDSSTGTEVDGTNYERVAVGGFGQGEFTVDATGSATNAAAFTFNDAESDWGVVTHIALFDAATGGNMLLYGTLDTTATVEAGDIFRVPTNGFNISVD